MRLIFIFDKTCHSHGLLLLDTERTNRTGRLHFVALKGLAQLQLTVVGYFPQRLQGLSPALQCFKLLFPETNGLEQILLLLQLLKGGQITVERVKHLLALLPDILNVLVVQQLLVLVLIVRLVRVFARLFIFQIVFGLNFDYFHFQ